MDEKKCWLVVCVQSNREKKTYERLSALGFESFLPLQEETRRTNSLIWRLFSMVRKKAVAAMVMVTVMDRVMVIRMRKRRRDYLDGRKRNPGNNAIISL